MIELSVSDVRAALTAVGRPGDLGAGEAATMRLGTLFHAVFADLVSSSPARSGVRVLLEEPPEERLRALRRHTFRHLFAPRLVAAAPALQSSTPAVMSTWRAVEHLLAWLEGVVLTLADHVTEGGAHMRTPLDGSSAHVAASEWRRVAELLRAEEQLACELRGDDWEEAVRLVGIADAVVRVPRPGAAPAALCVELKLGRSAPPIDLAQAALYRMLLARGAAAAPSAALAVVRFSPEPHELVLEGASLAEAEQALLEVIAALARVPRRPARVAPGAPATPAATRVSPPDPPSHTSPPSPPSHTSHTSHTCRTSAGLEATPDGERYAELGRKLVRACGEYGVGVELRGPPSVGPRFVRFHARLRPGSIRNVLQKRLGEIALRLGLERDPLVVREGGGLAIDLPRPDPALVELGTVLAQTPELVGDALVGSAKLIAGVDAGGVAHLVDLASTGRSHVLVAGTTGSGKSEWLRTAIATLLATNTPDTLRLVLIDPKLMAFRELEASPFLLSPSAFWVPGREQPAHELFDELADEMERRYQLTRRSGSDDLAEHVRKTGRPVPRIVCVCDEYMALVSEREIKRRVEATLSLLGAKARAAGIHLVLATQQPSRQIISGAVQTNLPCRVALALTSPIESRMIVGTDGAERLTGQGDLLYKDVGDPMRLQAPYLSSDERRRVFRAS